MVVRFNTSLYRLVTAFALSMATLSGLYAQAASPNAETSRDALVDTHGGLFRAVPEKSYFDDRSGIPLVEQFMKTWDARRHS